MEGQLVADHVSKVIFAEAVKNSEGGRRGFLSELSGTSAPHAKLVGDFGNATDVVRIIDCITF
jgi:hypothetical protein